MSYFNRPLWFNPKKLKWICLSSLWLNYNFPSKDGPPSKGTRTTKQLNNQSSRYSQLHSFSPSSITIWVNTTISCNISAWLEVWCLNTCFKTPQSLKRMLTVSCRYLSLLCITFLALRLVTLIGHLIWRGASPINPSSTSTLSPGSRKVISKSRKNWCHYILHSDMDYSPRRYPQW